MRTREGTIRVPGGEVCYRLVGDGGGVPLMILHGGPGAGCGAFDALESLAEQRPVLFYDQLGGGRSEQPDDPTLWRIERFVDEVGAVRRALGLDQVHLLGHSWGGFLALEYALTQPAGLTSLLLCSTAASVPQFEHEVNLLVDQLPGEIVTTLRRAGGTMADAEYFNATMAFMRRHLCRLQPWPDVLLEFNPMENPSYQLMWGPNEFTVLGNLRQWDRTARLAEIAVPSLVTCGRYDEATPACAETLRHGIVGAQLHVFENSAHMTFLEQPEEFLRVIGEFMVALEARS